MAVSKKDLCYFAPGSLSRSFTKEVEAVGCGSWVVRKESVDVYQKLSSATNKKERKFLLYGSDGNGKTMALLQMLWYCAQADWICVHVPSVFSWTYSRRDVRPSLMHEHLYDQPSEATQWLKNLKTLNSTQLTKLVTRKTHQWSKRDSSSAGDSLMSVVDSGLVKPLIATEVVKGVIDELLQIAETENVLLAIDELNGAYNPTMLKSMDKQWIEPNNLSLVHHMKSLYKDDSPVGVVAALSRTRMQRHHVSSTDPEALLGPEGMEECEHFHQVMIPPFSYEEFRDYLKQQYTSGWYIQGAYEDVAVLECTCNATSVCTW
jgi:hypothetical protein